MVSESLSAFKSFVFFNLVFFLHCFAVRTSQGPQGFKYNTRAAGYDTYLGITSSFVPPGVSSQRRLVRCFSLVVSFVIEIGAT